MIKLISFLFVLLFLQAATTSIYSISLPASQGDTAIAFSNYSGKKILIINTATNSSYNAQYQNLEKLQQQFKDSLVVIAIPSNDFGNEPDDDSTIAANVKTRYNISFLLAAKAPITGDATTPLYNWLQKETENGEMSSEVKGDFQKYLVDEKGNLVGLFSPEVDPLDEQVISAIRGK